MILNQEILSTWVQQSMNMVIMMEQGKKSKPDETTVGIKYNDGKLSKTSIWHCGLETVPLMRMLERRGKKKRKLRVEEMRMLHWTVGLTKIR